MKNFIQFMIPILVILGIGAYMMISSTNRESNPKLYIRCNDSGMFGRESFKVYTSETVNFKTDDEKCNLEITVSEIRSDYIRIRTPHLMNVDNDGRPNENDIKNVFFIEIGKELVVYSIDGETKYIFEFE